MNVGLLTQLCAIMKQVDSQSEFQSDTDTEVFGNVPCALDTLVVTNPQPTITPVAPVGRQQGVIFIVDPRLGRLPNRQFDETNYIALDGKLYEIAQIHEAINRMTGDLDHFEVQVYEGINR